MVTRVLYFISILLIGTFLPSHSFAVIYEWVDAGGIIHFSDRSDDIPLAYRNKLKIITEPHEMREGIMVPFERTDAGLILVNAVLNDRVKARMVFDTGANLVVITEELSEKLNQDLSSREDVIRIHTFSGVVEGKSLVIEKIDLEGVRKEKVQAVITLNNDGLGGFDGLLGLSFWGDFKVTVDYQNGKIIIEE